MCTLRSQVLANDRKFNSKKQPKEYLFKDATLGRKIKRSVPPTTIVHHQSLKERLKFKKKVGDMHI